LALWLRPPPEDDDAHANPRPVAMERPA
jgi:hypothetical protein